MKLKWWIFKNKICQQDFAETVPISGTYLTQIKQERVKPSIKTAKYISIATGGVVTVDELINPEHYPDPV